MSLFRRAKTPSDPPEPVPDPHGTMLDLIEQVAYMRGQVKSLEDEWRSTREQLRKDYQRVEKANQRADRREGRGSDSDDDVNSEPVRTEPSPLFGFAKKLHEWGA